jgi:CHAT domain-containing protein/tetratricopeptide (TPR) repeat protein
VDDIRRLLREARYGDAEKASRELLAATEASRGCDSVETAEAMDLVVEALWLGDKTKRGGEALDLVRRAIALKEKALGPEDARLVPSLKLEGSVLIDQGKYAEARRQLERALVLAVQAYGPDDRQVGRVQNELGNVLYNFDLDSAEKHRREALRIFEVTDGPDSIEVANALNGLANCVSGRGQYAEAVELYRRSLRIRETTLGPRHQKVAQSCMNLGYLHLETGDYEEARIEMERALSIQEETIGRTNGQTIKTLMNLAILNCKLALGCQESWERAVALADEGLGPDHDISVTVRANYAASLAETDPEKARRLNEEAYAAYSRIFGPLHARSLWVLSNLGSGALRAGDLATAERLLQQAVSGLEKAPSAPPSIFSGSLQELAKCRAESGRAAEARALHERALAIFEKAVGPENTEVASSLGEYGTFLRGTGDLGGAEAAHARALAIREKSFGSGHPEVAESLFALADLKAERGRFDEAMALFKRALVIQEKARTPDDPRNAAGLRMYASFSLRSGNSRAALDASLRAESIADRLLKVTLAGLPERQALLLVAKTPSSLGLAISSATRLNDPSATAKVLDAAIRSRALVLDEMAGRQRSLRETDEPGVARQLEAYNAARALLASLTVQGEDERFPEKSRRRIKAARADKDAAERALADRSWEFRRDRARAAAGLADVSSSLPRGGVLVGFVRYAHLSPASSASRKGKSAPPVDSYAAFVLRHGSPSPALVLLGPADPIDSRAGFVRTSLAPTAAALGGRSALSEASYRKAAAALRDLVWSSLEAHVAGAKTVFIVPDGSLRLVSFAAFPAGADSYLVEKGPVLHYLSAERDLVTAGAATGAGLLVAGAPDFDELPGPAATVPSVARQRDGSRASTSVLHRGPPPSCRNFASLRFVALPAAQLEVKEVADIWSSGTSPSSGQPRQPGHVGAPLVLSGPAANERAIKESAPGRHVVHLTTHGFFLGDCPSSPAGGKANPGESGAVAVYTENPLLLSGLALAGANRRGAALPGADDGILTAEEVASMDLSGVEWAVLSACETGLGEARSGEGLFGLRRAFQIAGARTLITSLWAVDDEASRRWMRALYERRLVGGLSTAESVREASLALLRERRAVGQSTHPFFWAGFVAAGDWR